MPPATFSSNKRPDEEGRQERRGTKGAPANHSRLFPACTLLRFMLLTGGGDAKPEGVVQNR